MAQVAVEALAVNLFVAGRGGDGGLRNSSRLVMSDMWISTLGTVMLEASPDGSCSGCRLRG